MSFPRPMKLSAAALALVAPLALVACGSGESDEAAAPSTSAVTSTTEATSEKETSSAVTTTSKAAETSEAEEANAQAKKETKEPNAQGEDPAAVGPADAAAGNPLEGEELQPVQNGQPADEATRGEISGLVNGWYEVGDMRAYMRYIPENTCSQVLAANPDIGEVDYNVFPQVPMDQVSDNWGAAGVQSIDDLAVSGDTASATVTVNTGEGVDSSVMRFKNEGGKWLFCN